MATVIRNDRLLSWYETRDGRGEDWFSCGEHHAFVFDGLGGTGAGQGTHPDGRIWKEAKIASRCCAAALDRVMEEKWPEWEETLTSGKLSRDEFAGRIETELEKTFSDALRQAAEEWHIEREIKSLPTTAAGWILFPFSEESVLGVAVWAGDSRCYLMTDSVMKQISRDDEREPKPAEMTTLADMKSDGAMGNHLGLDEDFRLHTRMTVQREPALFYACTDGGYQYVPSPMHLEACLREAASLESWEKMNEYLANEIGAYAGDDSCTFAGVFHDPEGGSFESFQHMMGANFEELCRKYIACYPEDPAVTEDIDATVIRFGKQVEEKRKDEFLRTIAKYILRAAGSREPVPEDSPVKRIAEKYRARYWEGRTAFERELRGKIQPRLDELEEKVREGISALFVISDRPYTIRHEIARRKLPWDSDFERLADLLLDPSGKLQQGDEAENLFPKDLFVRVDRFWKVILWSEEFREMIRNIIRTAEKEFRPDFTEQDIVNELEKENFIVQKCTRYLIRQWHASGERPAFLTDTTEIMENALRKAQEILKQQEKTIQEARRQTEENERTRERLWQEYAGEYIGWNQTESMLELIWPRAGSSENPPEGFPESRKEEPELSAEAAEEPEEKDENREKTDQGREPLPEQEESPAEKEPGEDALPEESEDAAEEQETAEIISQPAETAAGENDRKQEIAEQTEEKSALTE